MVLGMCAAFISVRATVHGICNQSAECVCNMKGNSNQNWILHESYWNVGNAKQRTWRIGCDVRM